MGAKDYPGRSRRAADGVFRFELDGNVAIRKVEKELDEAKTVRVKQISAVEPQ